MAEDGLKTKVAEWLDGEGYPLEFRAARAFDKAGFEVLQGEYIGGKDDDPLREIDLEAYKTSEAKKFMLRVYHVVECKWTKDKPWIVFSNQRSMAPSACITQTISNPVDSSGG